ncbi:hypothetical protein HYV74_02180 [Candidatus Uhrbacteria bacterium]|nr:hypothetical protein [Candidatus Uhrbacteria bacterium]
MGVIDLMGAGLTELGAICSGEVQEMGQRVQHWFFRERNCTLEVRIPRDEQRAIETAARALAKGIELARTSNNRGGNA